MVTLRIQCKKFVNKRQEALLCDGCNKWRHRMCRSGVSRGMYRNAVKSGEDIPWRSKLFPPCTINFVCLQTTVVVWFPFDCPFTTDVWQGTGSRSNCGIPISHTSYPGCQRFFVHGFWYPSCLYMETHNAKYFCPLCARKPLVPRVRTSW